MEKYLGIENTWHHGDGSSEKKYRTYRITINENIETISVHVCVVFYILTCNKLYTNSDNFTGNIIVVTFIPVLIIYSRE